MRRLIAGICLVSAAACASSGTSAAPPAVVAQKPPPASSAGSPAWSPGRVDQPPVAAPVPHQDNARIDRVSELRMELERVFASPELEHALWGVKIESLATAEVIFAQNPAKLVMPASNMKILTLAAAAERLGWDYRFETRLVTSGRIAHGTLRGDLILVGSGDPTIGERDDTRTRVFDSWAEQLKAAGIRGIDGRIIGDDNLFAEEGLGAGWAWDYLAYGYAAPSGALQFDEDTVELRIRAGHVPGDPVHLSVAPADSGLTIVNQLVTSPISGPFTIDLHRNAHSASLEVTGSVPADTEEFGREASIDNPTEFFARCLRTGLMDRGIHVRGPAIDVDTLSTRMSTGLEQQVLVRHLSPPLVEIATVLMKVSQNLYGDTLLKTLGARAGTGTAENGRKAVQEVLGSWGISDASYVMYDGSGLSRYNYVTADTVVKILRHLYEDPRHRSPFQATLPIAGLDGTLKGRMKNTPAEGNVRAKTGSIANVRALSGYVTTADGEPLAFSIIANNFNVPHSAVDAVADYAVARLAGFTRATAPSAGASR